ncbi:hypothetical protein [Trueperella pyogenes]
MKELKLARAGATLSVLTLTILAIGLLIQITGQHALAALIPGGTGLILVATGAYLILRSRGSADLAAAIKVTRGAALAAAAVVVVGVAAMGVTGSGVMTTLVLALVGLQAPIGLQMAASFLK